MRPWREPAPTDVRNGTGYKGRFGVHQSMRISDELNRIIMTDGNAIGIAEQAQHQGICEPDKPGLLKVRHGMTSHVEVEASINEQHMTR